MTATSERSAHRKPRRGTNVRHRQAQVGVRLSADELAELRAMADREGLTLPAALRAAFLRQAQADHR